MDVLSSGGERPLGDLVAGAADLAVRWRPPAWAVAALATVLVGTGAGGVVAADTLRTAAAEQATRVDLSVQASSATAVRPLARDGVLALELRNDGPRRVDVAAGSIDVAGLRSTGAGEPVQIEPGGTGRLVLPFTVRRCEDLAAEGTVELTTTPSGGEPVVVGLQVGSDDVPAGLLAAGCRPGADPAGVVVEVRALGGRAGPTSAGVQGLLELELRNQGGELRRVSVHAEVPGVQFSPASFTRVQAGGRVVARVPFQVPVCAAVRRTGRVVVTVWQDEQPPVELGFRATEDEEARTVRDVDLDLVLRSCR